jgi:aerobic-type carbon monoxide dehydrogenase small subunit (CoxS/CutS family)
MVSQDRNISLTLLYQGQAYSVRTFHNEYYSLMTLISAHLGIVGFGLCSGMGSCGTCLVEVGTKYSAATQLVLACDIRVNDELSNTQITISGRRY